jgi:hypothetical protein
MRVWRMHESTQIELSAADRVELKTIVANRNSPHEACLAGRDRHPLHPAFERRTEFPQILGVTVTYD